MYAKIALGNVRKSFRDFSVFFLTLAVGVCVFYAFGSITDQENTPSVTTLTRACFIIVMSCSRISGRSSHCSGL